MTTSTKPFARRLRTALFAVGFVGPLALLGGLSTAQEHPEGEKGPTAKQKFKNIKVLKDLPADQLIPVMHKFNTALGVGCDFCHVQDRASDAKPAKEAARKMIVMAQDLNKRVKVVDGKVTCYMCHHGKAEPERDSGGER